MMEMSPGDVIDKYTILRMKARHSREMDQELDIYRRASNLIIVPEIKEQVYTLIEMNARIWQLEASIRKGELDDLREVGRRALEIRDLNKLRVQAKAEIDKFYGFQPDIKFRHASE